MDVPAFIIHEAIQYRLGASDGWELYTYIKEHREHINLCIFDGYTPLQLAVIRDNAVFVKDFLEMGADVNIITSHLPLCTLAKTPDVLRILLKHGASVEAQDEKGNSVIHYFAIQLRLNMIALCMREGIQPILSPNYYGMSAFDMLKQRSEFVADSGLPEVEWIRNIPTTVGRVTKLAVRK